MNIKLTSNQYENLVKLISYGMWVVDSAEPENSNHEFRKIEQLILSQAAEHGYAGVNHHREGNYHEPGPQLIGQINTVLDTYEEIVFWDKLAYYLARRDYQQGISKSQANHMEHLSQLEEFYHDHLEKHGVSKLKISDE
ncbi:hypothetical protein [Peribacillus sp. SCS-155]|uniref:hypothetical protein n=1 Tax=Peribacillus sedimenti TaxID=3115297 RepID=UPI003905EC53